MNDSLPFARSLLTHLECGLLGRDERIVLFNTGAGLKYPETVGADAPVMSPQDDL